MEVVYTKKAKEDIAFWKSSGNKKIMAKISELIHAIEQNHFDGIGKPEPLNIIYPVAGPLELTRNIGLFMKLLIIKS